MTVTKKKVKKKNVKKVVAKRPVKKKAVKKKAKLKVKKTSLSKKRSAAAKKGWATRKKKESIVNSSVSVTVTAGEVYVPDEEIKELAAKMWELAGKPEGQDDKFWADAQRDLQQSLLKERVSNRNSCREVYRDDKLHVVEYLPQVRMCKFAIHGQKFQHYLAMPYMQFARYLGSQGMSLHVSFTQKPIEDIKQEVYFPPLPNVWWPSLQVCLMSCPGTSFDVAMQNFWNTRYLDCEDWYCFPVLEKDTPMKTYKRWEKMTEEDPRFILDVEWKHPACIANIPEFDVGGKQATHEWVGVKEYGGSHTNRFNGPIRGFAVVGYDQHDSRRKKILD